jgi:hypothetical protein
MKEILFAFGLLCCVAIGCSSKAGDLGVGGAGSCPQGNGSGSCYSTDSNNGAMTTCNYHSGNAASCGGLTSGHCPSSDLVGCCITTANADGCTETAAACYYSSDMSAAMQAMSVCSGGNGNADQGMVGWVTSPP